MNTASGTTTEKPADSAMQTARKALGMTPKDAAAAIGVTEHTYQQWEIGAMRPRAAKAQKIGQVLHLPLEKVPVFDTGRPRMAPGSRKRPDAAQLARAEKYAAYRARRVDLGLTQAELAKKAGVGKMAVTDMECGTHEPLWETRQKIRKALGWPEERYFTVEERNEQFLRMQHIIYWVLNRHREYLLEAGADLEDAFQDLALCAIRAIDRYSPDGGAKIETYLISQLMLAVKSIRCRAIAKGLCGKDAMILPFDAVVSLETLTDCGTEFEMAA